MKDIKVLFGKKIREYRIKRSMTQAQLAEFVNVDNKHISCIENGKNFPSADVLNKLAKALSVEPKDLFEFYYLQDSSNLKNDIVNMLDKLSPQDVQLAHKYIRTFLL